MIWDLSKQRQAFRLCLSFITYRLDSQYIYITVDTKMISILDCQLEPGGRKACIKFELETGTPDRRQ